MGDPRMLKLTDIVVDFAAQPRAKLCDQAIEDYAAAMLAGDKFPPVVVFRENLQVLPPQEPTYRLSHGYHRYMAAQRAGLEEILCEVHMGGWTQAVLFGVGANTSQIALRRTNADKRRAVELLLAVEEWAGKSDRWIAEQCKVSHPLVATVRQDLEDRKNGKTSTKEAAGKAGKGKAGGEHAGKARGEHGTWNADLGRYEAGTEKDGADAGGGGERTPSPGRSDSPYLAERVLRKLEGISEAFNGLIAAALEDRSALKDEDLAEVKRVLTAIRDGAKDMLAKLKEAKA